MAFPTFAAWLHAQRHLMALDQWDNEGGAISGRAIDRPCRSPESAQSVPGRSARIRDAMRPLRT